MTAECYECATAGGHEGSEFLKVSGMMRIFADECVKCECNVTHYAKNESEAIPAERNGRAERSREKMNAQWMWKNDCERLESHSSPPLSLCEIFVCSNRNAPWRGVVREHKRMYCCGSESAEGALINTQKGGEERGK